VLYIWQERGLIKTGEYLRRQRLGCGIWNNGEDPIIAIIASTKRDLVGSGFMLAGERGVEWGIGNGTR